MNTRPYQTWKKVLTVILFYLFTFLPLTAQTFTQRIQQKTPAGQGTVTIHQSDSIDRLVNQATLGTTGIPQQATTTHATTATTSSHALTKPTTSTTTTTTTETETPVDTSKKIMRGGYKVNGYRVQVYAGGNSRKDRQEAERIGNDIKMQYGTVPVYVHFYSPRWICRVGNFRTYEEAHQMLSSLRKAGYSQATIVKGKITVAY